MPRPHIEPYCELDFDFKKFTLPGFTRGRLFKTLSMDTDTGACTLKMRFEPGFRQKPGFSRSEIEIFVLAGSLTVGDRRWTYGQYVFVPAGVTMPAMSTDEGCEALVYYNSREPDFIESDRDGNNADRAGLVDVNALADVKWIIPSVTPGPATGCLIKLLKFNERTHAMTFIYCLTPAYWQDNISYHDCAEESYHIWGTSWMMQFGDLPTGGYFWRPPYINHGAFTSAHGTLAIGRVDSEIFNHFHYNPWSTPEENQDRATARLRRQKPWMYQWVASHGHNHPHGPEDFEYPPDSDQARHGPNIAGSTTGPNPA
jgi:hypothetical protein